MHSATPSTPVSPRTHTPVPKRHAHSPSHTTRAVLRRRRRVAAKAAGRATVAGVAVSATLVASLLATQPTASATTYPTGAGVVLNAPIVSVSATPDGHGYWLVGADGGVFAFGDATFHGSVAGLNLNSPIVGIHSTADGQGYWEVAADGGVFAFGDAAFHGSVAGLPLNSPIVGITPTADGHGYWEVAADGGVFNFGDATYQGAATTLSPTSPIVGIAATADRQGYWELAANGDVYAFGEAGFYGTVPVTGQAVGIDAAGGGYRVVSSAGGTYAAGGAAYEGSLVGLPLNRPIVGTSSTGSGYVDVAADGGVFNFGSVGYYGSLGGSTLHVTAPAAAATVVDYGLTPGQIAAWSQVNMCEEGGNWHVEGSVFAGGLGMSRANWSQFNSFGFPADEAAATPDQQIRVAVAFAARYYGSPYAAPDQGGCHGGY